MLIKKFLNPIRGLFTAITKDRGVQLQILFTGVSLPAIFYIFKPLTTTELMFIVVGYGLLFITELQNTSLERSLDRLHPEKHVEIRDSKDIAAGSVLLALFIFIIVIFLLAQSRGMI